MKFRRTFCQRTLSPWLILILGMVLGVLLTSSITFQYWQHTQHDFSVDRETLSIVQVNERIRTNKNFLPLHLPALQDPRCICGEEAERLRKVVPCPEATDEVHFQHDNILHPPDRPSRSLVAKPTDQTFIPPSINENSEGFSGYIDPLSANKSRPKELHYLSREYQLKKQLLVAVLTTEKQLDQAAAVYNTWGQDVSQILFFVGEDCNISLSEEARGIPVVKLPGIVDRPADPVAKTFAALKYIHENYIDTFHWFMQVTDSTYVHGKKLQKLIMRLDSSKKIYLGRAASGREEDLDRLKLLPHEYYCHGGAGVVMSHGLLNDLALHLDYCLGAVRHHNQETGEGGSWSHADVEVGRCVSRTVGIQCSQSAEAKAYFVNDYSKTALTQKVLGSSPTFKNLITYYPVPTSVAMATLHRHYKQQDFLSTLEIVKYVESQISEICRELESNGAQVPPQCEVSICSCEKYTDDVKCPSAGVVSVPAKSYQPISKDDYQSWEYFDATTIYNDETMQPGYWLRMQRNRKYELQLMLGKMMQVASQQHGRYMKFRKVKNGWVRHNPMRGNEYIIDAEFSEGRNGKVVEQRISLVRPLAINYIPLEDNSDTQTPIHFVVPITNVNDRFKEFMNMYENKFLKTGERVKLVLSVYGDTDVMFVRNVLVSYRKKYPETSITVVEGKGQFSRGKALHLGMTKLYNEDLAFLCDVDMTVEEGFLDRCRKNTIRGKRVYYPEFFKLYNLDYVYRNGKPRLRFVLKRLNGHWAYYSFGMLCIYKSDYESVGGMNTNIVGWGEEDVNFFDRVLKKRLEVLRAPDVSLKHRWHEKHCPSTLSEKQYKHCLSSRAENLADRIELANYIYEHNMQIKYSTESSEPVRTNSTK